MNYQSQGNKGQLVHTNFYEMRVDPNSQIYRYQFQFEPTLIKEVEQSKWRDIFKIVKQALSDCLKVFLINNQVIYSPNRAPQTLQNLGHVHTINLEEKAIIKAGEAEYTSLMGRFFKMMLRNQKLLQIGRKYFDTTDIKNFDQFGIKVLPGLLCNLVRQEKQGQYFINVDCSFKVLRTQTLYEELRNCKDFAQLEGAIIMTTYNYKFYKVNKINRSQTPAQDFSKEDGKTVSYTDYYKERYGVTIRDMKQPLIEVIEKSRKQAVEKTLYLIPELCVLTGLSNEMKNNFQTMKQLATVTKPRGVDRVRQADKFISCFYQKESEQLMKNWNIQLSKQCLQIESQKLNAGDIVMCNNQRSFPIETSNLDRDTQCEMLRSVKLNVWGILYQDRDQRQADDFMSCLRESIEFCRFPCSPPKTFNIPSNRADDWLAKLEQIAQLAKGPEYIIVLSLRWRGAKKSAPLYTDLKRFLVNKYPIASQVILTSTINQPRGKLKTICNKLLVQMTAKVGGTPWGISDLPFAGQPTMVCGMDVYHCTTKTRQSFLSFVSTDDQFFSRYYAQSIEMDQGVEFSSNLCSVLIKSIEAFTHNKQNPMPMNIIIYRDGVSNSQAKVVIENEVAQFRQAIQLVQEAQQSTSKVNLVVISVNKKVGAKFYAGERNLDNPPQGTLIDSSISDGKSDFYLIAQRTNQGTVQPTHYHVLVNDLESDPSIFKKLQNLSYKLCYMYYNFSGAIKIPAPIQYAHVCSNFIGDRYDQKDPESLIRPHQVLVDRRSLFFI